MNQCSNSRQRVSLTSAPSVTAQVLPDSSATPHVVTPLTQTSQLTQFDRETHSDISQLTHSTVLDLTARLNQAL